MNPSDYSIEKYIDTDLEEDMRNVFSFFHYSSKSDFTITDNVVLLYCKYRGKRFKYKELSKLLDLTENMCRKTIAKLRHADLLVSESKTRGGNKVYYEPTEKGEDLIRKWMLNRRFYKQLPLHDTVKIHEKDFRKKRVKHGSDKLWDYLGRDREEDE